MNDLQKARDAFDRIAELCRFYHTYRPQDFSRKVEGIAKDFLKATETKGTDIGQPFPYRGRSYPFRLMSLDYEVPYPTVLAISDEIEQGERISHPASLSQRHLRMADELANYWAGDGACALLMHIRDTLHYWGRI